VKKVLELAALDGDNSVVVICGTGYIMPDAREVLGIKEPRCANGSSNDAIPIRC
jgi:hypothetical protein